VIFPCDCPGYLAILTVSFFSAIVIGRFGVRIGYPLFPWDYMIMEKEILRMFRKHWIGAALAGLLFSALAVLFTVFFSPKYSVRTDFLITQEATEGKDYYALTRSSEYASKILTEVIGSDRFIDEVFGTGKLDSDFLPSGKRERLREWNKLVSVGSEADLGIIRVTVSGDRLLETQKTAQAVEEIITGKNGVFFGSGERNMPIHVLSGPISQRNPDFATFSSVALGAFFLGFLIALSVVFLRNERGRMV